MAEIPSLILSLCLIKSFIMKSPLLLLAFGLLSCQMVNAQINVSEEYTVTQMMSRHRSVSSLKEVMDGWAIQILVTDNKFKAEQAKVKFLERYPQIKASLDFQSPYHKLKVGAFLNKKDALDLQQKLKMDYPDSYPVISQIKIRDVI